MFRSRVLRSVRALSVGGAAAITAAAVYEPGFRRELDFWWEGGAIIAKYVVVKLKYDFIFSDEEARSRRYEELHEENAPAALAAILELRGLYIKFGQVCSARDQMQERPEFVESHVDDVLPFSCLCTNPASWASGVQCKTRIRARRPLAAAVHPPPAPSTTA